MKPPHWFRPAATAYQVKALPQIFGDVDLSWTSADFDRLFLDRSPAMPFVFDGDFDGAYQFRKEVVLHQAQVDAATTLLWVQSTTLIEPLSTNSDWAKPI
ncbi:MAG: hypothetical protein R2688_00850 [Fimbriimonadaceae bacterium]